MTEVDAAPAATAWRMAVPRVWARFPAEPVRLRHAVRGWLLERMSHLPRDRTVQRRRQIEEQLVEVARGPGAEYAQQLMVLSFDVDDVPVTATCVVALVPHRVEGAEGLARLAVEVGGEVAEVGRHLAVLVVRDDRVRHPGDDPSDADLVEPVSRLAGRPVTEQEVAREREAAERVRVVEVHVPVPDDERTLVLTFSTPLVALFDAMTELFTTMAATLQLQDADGVWR